MSWTTPRTWTVGEVLTAANLNTHLRDNLNQTAPALVTTKGDVVAATAANTLARIAVGTDGYALIADAASTPGVKWGLVGAILKVAGAGHALLPGGAPVEVTAGAGSYGSYGQLRAASGNAVYLTALEATSNTAANAGLYAQFMIGTGGAGSETAVSEIGYLFRRDSDTGKPMPPRMTLWPWIAVAASTRIAVKAMSTAADLYDFTLASIDQANVAYG